MLDVRCFLLLLRSRTVRALVVGCVFVGHVSISSAAEVRGVAGFFQKHCHECHGDGTEEGGLDLQKLGKSLDDRGLFAKWERIHDRVLSGEMPPKTSDQPTATERAAFVKSLASELTAAHAAQKGTVLRRLNRREYQNTMNDLFGTNLKLAERLPEDSRAHEFENVGEALGISMVQMQRYLECTKTVLDESIARTIERPESKIVRASYADTQGAEKWLNKIWLKRDDGAVVFFKPFGYPSGMLREANVREDGWYKVRVTGYAFQTKQPVTFSIGATTFARGVEQPTFGFYSLPPGEPNTIEVRAWIPRNYMIDLNIYGIVDQNNELKAEKVAEYRGPGLAIQNIEIEGPLIEEFPSRGHKLVFDGLNRAEVMPKNLDERKRTNYKPKFEVAVIGSTTDQTVAVREVLNRIAKRAFRRPVDDAQITPYLKLFDEERKQGATFEDALRTAVTAIFCSPDFLFLREIVRGDSVETVSSVTSRALDDYALAARLSYFLNRTLADDELLAVAASGKLTSDREVLLAQTERLLKQDHAARFVEDFTDAWLGLRDIDFTNPDSKLFPEFDPFLRYSMLEETREFTRKLVEDNLHVSNIVRSDIAMLNSRLADHYGIAGVDGPELRPVKLPTDSIRGGLLSQASVLKVSANGTNTSPVVRGVWVMERIMGQTPAPPPPGIPGVEPDIRGATTLRELLDKHRNVDSCRSCHQLIDPPGFALESFDPIGGWRDHFRSLGNGARVDAKVGNRKVQYKQGPAVDASGQLADGRAFAGFREFRDLLAEDQDLLARTLATKLLTFSTGREMGFSDRAQIDAIVAQSKAKGHGVRDLLKLVVLSESFRMK